jgi:phospholipase/lecithinase/hemolysin
VLKRGVNYASGGGGILNETGSLFIQRLCLWKQIEMFQSTKMTIAKKIGHARAEKFFNGSIYLMSIGSNDYINNYLLPVQADSWEYTPDDFINYLVSTLRQQLTTLHQLGVRQLLFTGLGPVGCIPLQRVLTTDGSCQQILNDYAVKFNAAVKNLITDLSSKLPAAGFIFTDGYDFFTKMIENPKAYGFENSDTPCCSFGRYRPTLSCVGAAKLCPDRSKYLFWDEYHPSDAANLMIVETLLSTFNLSPGNSSHSPAPAPLLSPSPSPS